MVRAFDPLKPDHPLVGSTQHECPFCVTPFKAGDVVCLIPKSPTENRNVWEAAPAHWDCYQKAAGD